MLSIIRSLLRTFSYSFIFYLLFQINTLTASERLIQAKVIRNNEVRFYLSKEFAKTYVKQPLFLAYPCQIDLISIPSSIVDIPLINHVIAVVWLSGKEYTIEEMDEDLYYSLIKVKAFFKRFFYNTSWEGELKPDRLVKNVSPKSDRQSAVLFTGGLDSTNSVFRHLEENPLLISFNDPHRTASEFAKSHSLDLYTIYTNYKDCLKLTALDKASCDITKWFWDTSMALSWVGTAAPFLYAMGIPILYIPSGFTWDSFLFPDGQTLRQPASPFIDENLSPMGLQVVHDVFTMTRTDKIKFISTFCTDKQIPKPQLVVCNYHKRRDIAYSHCNRCMKCFLTMLDILAIGDRLSDYGFTLTEEEFISQFQVYLTNIKTRRGGTYVACKDTQRYVKQHIHMLPDMYRSFYEWFASFDLWTIIEEPSDRPLRTNPFNWMDYQDLFPTERF